MRSPKMVGCGCGSWIRALCTRRWVKVPPHDVQTARAFPLTLISISHTSQLFFENEKKSREWLNHLLRVEFDHFFGRALINNSAVIQNDYFIAKLNDERKTV